jgi:NAD(P)-dependent dehydrogenase (short-subunit alcohol dehydrogenase family)
MSEQLDFAGKVAMVTGGSRGIGAATASRLARFGATVAIDHHQAADHAAAVVDD